MGLIEKILKKPKKVEGKEFQTFTEYAPAFSSFGGSIYEQELTRAAIDRFAVACSKLNPSVTGSAKPNVRSFIETRPNEYMSWSKFLYRLGTILECDTTAYIIPAFGKDLETVVGVFPLKCQSAEVVEYKGEAWIRFHHQNGEDTAIEMKRVGILTRFQNDSDFFGGGHCIRPTMELIHAQNQAQRNAIRNGANIRFIGSLVGQVREEDMERKRERFAASNLSPNNKSSILLYDQTFESVKQIEPQSYVVDSAEMERINDNVYTYFGINKRILQNDYDENVWGAWYEGKVEPFAIQLGDALTQMLFTAREQKAGNAVTFASSRLAYASNRSKRDMIRDMLDRGVFSINEARDVLQLPPIEDGDRRVIRGEYIDASNLPNHTVGGAGSISEDHDDYREDGGGDASEGQ